MQGLTQQPLFDAIEDQDEGAVRRCLAQGGSPNLALEDTPTWTPLHAGVSEIYEDGPLGVVLALLEHGAFVDPVDDAGNTPLLLAARDESWDAASILLEAGADPSRLNIDNYSPLAYAAEEDSIDIVRRMLGTGKCASIINKWIGTSGATLLCLAADKTNAEMIQLLVESGADIYTKDDQHRLPISRLPEPEDVDQDQWMRAVDLLSEGRG